LRQPGGFGRDIEAFLLNPHDKPGTHGAGP